MTQISSTGSLGFSLRGDERAYNNYPVVTDANVDAFMGDVAEHFSLVGTQQSGTEITRAVLRAVVDEDTFDALLTDPVAQHIEAAAPLRANGVDEYLAYFARNAVSRGVDPEARESLKANVSRAKSLPVDQLTNDGLDFTPFFTSEVDDPEQLNKLWGDTFGWDLEGCTEFAQQVRDQASTPPQDRSVWFKGLRDEHGNLVASAMAERLDVPGTAGDVALIEHTEWATDPQKRGMKLGRRVVGALTADVQRDMSGVNHLVFAECNMNSGANVVAVRSGFTVPSITTPNGHEIGQVLHNNVRVDDGLPPLHGYRNFMFAVVE